MPDELLSPTAHITVPDGPIPVMAVVNGERTQIGTGVLDTRTGVFTTTFNDTPAAQSLGHFLTDNNFYSLPVKISEVQTDTKIDDLPKSNLVEHARRELERINEDPHTVEGCLKIVQAFADMGHSGGSAAFFIPMLNDLLQFKNIAPLTNDPEEWMYISEDTWGASGGIWQSRRNPEAFSNDGGKHYYLLSEGGSDLNRHPLHEAKDA